MKYINPPPITRPQICHRSLRDLTPVSPTVGTDDLFYYLKPHNTLSLQRNSDFYVRFFAVDLWEREH